MTSNLTLKFLIKTFCTAVLYMLAYTAGAQEAGNRYFFETDTSAIFSLIRDADKIVAQSPDSANAQYEQAFELCKREKLTKGIVYCATRIGSYYFNNRHNYTKALETLKDAVPYFQKLDKKDHWLLPTTCNLLGNAYFKTGINDSAIYYYSKALRAFDSLGIKKPKLHAQVYGNMGAVLSASGQYISGINYLKNALKIPEIDSSDLANAYANLGALYANYIKDMDSATYWWGFAIKLYRDLSAPFQLQDIYANMGTGWGHTLHLDLEKSWRYFDTAIQIDPAAAEHNVMIQQGLAAISYYKGNYKKAIEYSRKALEIAERTGNRERKQYAYWTLSYCYEHLNDTQKAHQYQHELALLEDSISNETIIQSISESETKYRLSEKNKELAQNKARVYQQQLWLAGSIGGSLVLVLLLLGAFNLHKQKQKRHATQLKELQQQQNIETLYARMDAEEKERARIARELHDGLGVLVSAAKINYNMLGKSLPASLYAGTPYREGEAILNHIHSEMRTLSHNLIPDYITLRSLEDVLSQLIKRVSTENFIIHLEKYGDYHELHPEKSFAVYRALEEIINNALRHSEGSELSIQLFYHPQQLHIITEDNGKGFNASQKHTGLGLRNIERRITDIQGYITLNAQPGAGTSYAIEIPY